MKKIMFNTELGLEQAVLDGRKTQTRRVIKVDEEKLNDFREIYYDATLDYLEGKNLLEAYFVNNPQKLPYRIGEIVAIAQSYKSLCYQPTDKTPIIKGDKIEFIEFRDHKGWNNKMFVSADNMINFIRITNVRIESLQDISDEDCLAEGIIKCDAEGCHNQCYLMSKCNFCHCGNAKDTPREERYKEPIICRIYGSKKNNVQVILPILNWTEEDVEEFINVRCIKCHPLYYNEYGTFNVKKRLGCIGCPMKSDNGLSDFKKYPNMVKAWINAGMVWWNTHPNLKSHDKFESIYDLFVHNVFFDSYAKFKEWKYNLFDTVDCKKFLEDYFKIKL